MTRMENTVNRKITKAFSACIRKKYELQHGMADKSQAEEIVNDFFKLATEIQGEELDRNEMKMVMLTEQYSALIGYCLTNEISWDDITKEIIDKALSLYELKAERYFYC